MIYFHVWYNWQKHRPKGNFLVAKTEWVLHSLLFESLQPSTWEITQGNRVFDWWHADTSPLWWGKHFDGIDGERGSCLLTSRLQLMRQSWGRHVTRAWRGMGSYSPPDQPCSGSLPPARLHLLKVAKDHPLLSDGRQQKGCDGSRQALESLSLVN